jgi:hypothetical protein
MKIKVLVAILLVALVASVSIASASNKDPQPQQGQIEDVIKSYAWSMDDPNGKENWLSVFSDDLENYKVSMYVSGSFVPVLDVANLQPTDPNFGFLFFLYPEFSEWTPKQRLEVMCDYMIFLRVAIGQSFLSNMVIDISGSTAEGKDYFSHWERVNPGFGLDPTLWYFQEGKHFYNLAKEGDQWKVTNFEGFILRTEARPIP